MAFQFKQNDLSASRRNVLRGLAGTVFVSAIPIGASATPANLEAARKELFGDRPINEGRVKLDLPPIAENGYSVPVSIDVDSPMTDEDFVNRIVLLSERNPIANISHYKLGPRAGRALVQSRIRLSGSQTLLAIAEMNDGSLWSGTKETVVTLAACVIL